MSNFSDYIGGGGSASLINEVVLMNDSDPVVTLDDGRVYLKGGAFETNLATYPLAKSSMQQAGVSFSVSAQEADPRGLTWDGTNYWVVGTSNDTAYKYTSAGVYTGTSFSVAAQTATPYGIEWDGTFFWVMSNSGVVYKYNSAGVYQSAWTANAEVGSSGRDIVWDGTSFWVLTYTGSIYKYNSAGVYQSYLYISAQSTGSSGITWDGTYFWVADSTLKLVFKYDASFVYQDESFDISSEEPSSSALAWTGTHVAMVGTNKDEVHEYRLANGVESVPTSGGQNYVRVA